MGADTNVLRRRTDFWRTFAFILTTILLLGFSGHGMAASKMYFTEAGPTLYNLQRANTDGTSLEVIVPDDGVNNVHEEMFVEPSTNMLYFVDDRADALPGIYKVDLTGTFPATPTLVIEHDGIQSMVFDSANGRIYYTTANTAPVDYALYRCNLDGTNKTTMIQDDGVWSPTDLWLDETGGTLFVANLAGSTGIVKIATSSLPTTTASLISVLSTANRVESIYGYLGKIYYNDLTNFVLKRINFDGTGDEAVIADDAAWQPEALYVDDTTSTLYLSDTAAPSIRKVAISSLPSGTAGAAALTQVIAKKALAILVHSDNAAPTIGGTAAGYTSNDTATVSPFPAVTIGDADGNNVTTIVTLDTNAKGVFTPSSLTASGFTGTGPYTLAATSPATAQTKIRQLVFDPADNRVAPTTTETTTFTITVNDGTAADVTDSTTTVISTSVNDAPTITSNGGGASAAVNAAENQSAVTTVTSTDDDTGDSATYSISGGADAAKFSIVGATGVLTFVAPPNFEAPTDAGANNVYDVQVTVTDGGSLIDVQDIAVTVTNVNEAPVITGQAALTTPVDTALTVTLGDLTVTDPDNSYPTGFTLTLQSGANYSLSGNTMTPAPGYIGSLTIPATVNDGTNDSALFNLLVTVNLGNTAPTISGTPATGVGDDVPYSFVPTANDVDGDPLTFSILNKPAWASFNISTGALSGTPTPANIGTTTGIVISVSDGSLSDSLVAFDLEVYADLDNDNIADSVDTDDDGDGMSDSWEIANGLDPRDASDASGDVDGDGVNNLDEFLATTDPQVDDYPPVVTAPADISVDAVGLFTAVDLGSATAVDDLDGDLTPTSDALSHFTPGAHTVTWSATDVAGNTGTATQTVNVVPQVSFDKEQTIAEGGTVTFRVILNGPAVTYPVTIPYSVGGTAATDGSDHNLINGDITISSGSEASISFITVDDGVDEGTETVVITMGVPTNAVPGTHSVDTIEIVENNLPPEVTLSAEQGAGLTHTIVIGNGPVTVSSTVIELNPPDTHSYDWTGTDNALIDTDGAVDTFTFDPSVLSPGFYTLHLSVSDGTAASDFVLPLNVLAAAPALSSIDDSDGDGLTDALEGYGDADGNGIPDYLDAIDSSNVLQEIRARIDSSLIETEPGLRLRLGSVAFRSGQNQAMVSVNDIVSYGGVAADSDNLYAGGLFDFTVDRIPVAGQSVQVVLPQQAAIPANAVYRKVVGGLWQNFVEDANNSVASAAGVQGYCPPPGDSAYTPGLTEGNWCVQLTIEDGGPNDADATANNSVADPGGVTSVAATQNTGTLRVSSGGGSGSPWLLVLLGMLLWRAQLVQREARG